jgi:hypothetical protein
MKLPLLVPAALLAVVAGLVAPRIARSAGSGPTPAAAPPIPTAAVAPIPEKQADPASPAVPVPEVALPAAPPARTKKPAVADWKTAPEVKLARTIKECKAQQIAEWMRIRCDLDVSSASLLAGDAHDVAFAPLEKNAAFSVVVALRPGDRRVIQLNHFFSFSRWGASEAGAAEISELWLPGAAAPVVVVN